MTSRIPLSVFNLCLLLFLIPISTWGWGRGIEDFETPHNLSYGAGISSPSMTTALIENPAGLAYNLSFKGMLEGVTNSYSFNPLGGGGSLLIGNGVVGAGAGLNLFNASGTGTGSLGVLNTGIGAQISPAHLALGVTFNYTLWNTGASQTGFGTSSLWGIGAGVLIFPEGPVRGGLTINQIGTSYEFLGAGVSWEFTEFSVITVDATRGLRGAGTVLTPGLGIHLYNFQAGLGYGIPVEQGTFGSRTGPNAALGVRFNQNFHLEAYYNHLALFCVRLIIQI